MANQLDNFDKLIKESFEGFEVPYNSNHWEELKSNLNTTSPSLPSYFGAITTGLAVTGIVFLAMLFFFSDYQSEHMEVAQTQTSYNNGSGNSGLEMATANVNGNAKQNIQEADSSRNVENINTGNENQKLVEANVSVNEINEESKSNNNSFSENQDIKSKSDIPVKTIKGTSGENSTKVRTGCTGLVINFVASEEFGSDAKYLWNFGDGFFSNEAKPSHTFNKEGVFDVSLSVTSKTTGQISSNVVQAMIEVNEAPIANFKVEINNPHSVLVKNESYNASDLSWTLNGKELINKKDINVSVADNTRQSLTLSVNNDGGCTDTLETTINSISSGSKFPKAIDLSAGVNFAPGAILDKGDIQSIKIYEKSTGKLAFEGEGNKGWIGTDMSGNKSAKGTYQWLMAVKNSQGFDIYKGNIELR